MKDFFDRKIKFKLHEFCNILDPNVFFVFNCLSPESKIFSKLIKNLLYFSRFRSCIDDALIGGSGNGMAVEEEEDCLEVILANNQISQGSPDEESINDSGHGMNVEEGEACLEAILANNQISQAISELHENLAPINHDRNLRQTRQRRSNNANTW